MFERIKDAAQKGKIERRLRALLDEAGVGTGAGVTIRQLGAQLRATVILADNPNLSGQEAKVLETRLAQVEGLDAATLVTTIHKEAGHKEAGQKETGPSPERVQAGHDNPLSLPGRRATGPREKIRPGNAAHVLAVASGKGGVGKSTVAAQLARALASQGQRVGLLDLDIYGPSLPVLFGLDGARPEVEDGQIMPLHAHGLEMMSIGFLVSEEKSLAWRGPMVMGAAKQLLGEVKWGPLDWLIIDTPPGTGDAHLTLMQNAQIDGALIISTPSPLAVADVRRGAALFRKMGVAIVGLVENMASLPDGSMPFGAGLDDATLAGLGLDRLVTLPLDPVLGIVTGGNAAPEPVFKDLADAVARELDRPAKPQ